MGRDVRLERTARLLYTIAEMLRKRANETSTSSQRPPRSRRKKILAAVLSPLVFLLLAEVGLRVSGLYDRLSFLDLPEKDGAYRVFVVGASSVVGVPFDRRAGMVEWLWVYLHDLFPARKIQVHNVSYKAISSYGVLRLFERIINARPDLVILYFGHNEWVHLGSHAAVTREPLWVSKLRIVLDRSAVYRSLRRLLGRPTVDVDTSEKVSNRDYNPIDPQKHYGGREGWQHLYIADYEDCCRRDMVRQYARNLEKIASLARTHHVKIMLTTVVSNLADFYPQKSTYSPRLSAEEQAKWLEHFNRGTELCEGRDFRAALDALVEAAEIDQRHAGLSFLMAKCHDGLGEYDRARELYLRARDSDAAPIRAYGAINETIEQIAKKHELPVADASRAFEREAHEGVPGDDLFIDGVHPNLWGHRLVARVFAETMRDHELLAPKEQWHFSRLGTHKAQSRSLGLSSARCAMRVWEFAERHGAEGSVMKLPYGKHLVVPVEADRSGRSVALYKYAITLAPEAAGLLSSRSKRPFPLLVARAYFELGQYERALQQYEAALRQKPGSRAAAFQGLAETLAAMGRRDDAISVLKDALRHAPQNPQLQRALEHLMAESGAGE